PAALLDTYEAERRPDVAAATRLAIAWGSVLQTRRPRLARWRDAVLFALDATPLADRLRRVARARPPLRRGALLLPRQAGVGSVFPQPRLASGARLDDVLGNGWAVLGAVSEEERAAWSAAGVPLPGVADAVGEIAAWLRRHRADWVALRPDRVVFASGRAGEGVRAARAVAAWLGRA
ncbi:MAG TPA: hypothetical protein VF533_19235, partial [Solirubrobacteraceae bacterium]